MFRQLEREAKDAEARKLVFVTAPNGAAGMDGASNDSGDQPQKKAA